MTRRRAITVLFFASIFLAARPALAQRYTVENIDIDASVRADGSLDVREILTYDFRGRFSFAYRDIPRSSTTRVGEIRVAEDGREYRASASTEPGNFSVEERPPSIRITWRYRTDGGRRTFAVHYRVSGEVRRYADTAELYYKFVGDQWDRPIGSVSATVRFMQPVPSSDLRAWAHGPLHGRVNIASGRVEHEERTEQRRGSVALADAVARMVRSMDANAGGLAA